MASINKDIPNTSDPNYLGYAHPISQPGGDKSLGVALAGLGSAIREGTAAADFLVKEHISDAVDAGVDTTRDIFTAGLETVAGKPAPSLTGEDPNANLPGDVKTVGNQATNLRTAMEAGKISPTAYYGKLTAIAKQLRSQYPGYRDFIDSQISQAAGVNPANAYMRSLMSDINTRASSSASMAKSQFNFIQKEAPELAPAVLAGKATLSQAYVEATTRAAQDLELKRRAALRTDIQGQRTDIANSASDTANLQASFAVRNALSNITLTSGLDHPMTVQDLLNKIHTGWKPTEDQARAIDQQFQAQVAIQSAKLYSDWSKPDANGHSIITQLGTDGGNKANEIIQNSFGKQMAYISDLLHNKEYGLAYSESKHIQSVSDSTQSSLMDDPGVGPTIALSSAVAKLMPNSVPLQQIFKDALTGKLNKDGQTIDQSFGTFYSKFANRYKENLGKMITQSVPKKNPDGTFTAVPAPQPITLKKIIIDDQAKGMALPQTYNGYLDYINRIADPNVPDNAKLNLFKAAFSDQNLGVLGMFTDDVVDPQTGRKIPGKFYAFNKMTSPAVTQSIKHLSDIYGPQYWVQYKGYAETEFGRELFGQAIRNLQAVQDSPNVQISYNSDIHQFSYKYHASLDRPPDIVTAPGGVNPLVRNSIDNLNLGLRSIVNIAKTEGSDPDAYLLGLFRQIGFTPDPKSIQGLPQQMINALATAHQKASLAEQVLGDNTFNTKTKGKTSERMPPNMPIVAGQ